MSRQILEEVRNELIACRAVSSNREFCESWLARDESYLRVLRFHNMSPSADALATCASKLGYYARHLGKSDKLEHQQWVARFEQLRGICLQEMDQQAKTKWMTAERMGL